MHQLGLCAGRAAVGDCSCVLGSFGAIQAVEGSLGRGLTRVPIHSCALCTPNCQVNPEPSSHQLLFSKPHPTTPRYDAFIKKQTEDFLREKQADNPAADGADTKSEGLRGVEPALAQAAGQVSLTTHFPHMSRPILPISHLYYYSQSRSRSGGRSIGRRSCRRCSHL